MDRRALELWLYASTSAATREEAHEMATAEPELYTQLYYLSLGDLGDNASRASKIEWGELG